MSDFPCSVTRNITSYSVKNLSFDSLLRWKFFNLGVKGIDDEMNDVILELLFEMAVKNSA